MKFTKIMAAVAALAGTSAFALPNADEVAITAGASASRANMISAFVSLCTSGGGVATQLGSGNFRSVVCADSTVTEGPAGTYVSKAPTAFKKLAGTNFVEVRINTEGSFSSVILLNPSLNPNPTVRNPATASNSAVYPVAGVDGFPGSGAAVRIGGLLDLDAANGFPATTIGANTLYTTNKVGIAQTFGVGATNALYDKMYAAQKAAGLIPAATCDALAPAARYATSYCVPSISIAQMATIMADNPFNAAYSNGLGFLTGDAADVGVELRYARRVNNSGTQGVAQAYFLGLPCSREPLSIVPEPTGDDEPGGLKDALITSIRVLASPGTGDVLNELNATTNLDGSTKYALGVVSGENAQATNTNWRWLRVNGVAMAEKADPIGNINTASAINGQYNFAFESVYMGGSAAADAFWATVSATMNALPAPSGLINNTTLSAGYNKNGLACQGWSSN